MTALLVTLTSGCDDQARPAGREIEVGGTVTAFGRVDHAGTRVVSVPGGNEAVTDHRGWFRTDAVYGGELRVERPGFATTHSGLDTPIDLTLYRGRAFDLPTGFEVAESRRLPPGGLLVWDASGAGLLLDLERGEVRLELPSGWTPYTDLDGWVISYGDDLAAEVEAVTLDGESRGTVRGWSPHGSVQRGDASAVVVARPWPDDPVHLQVGLWVPDGRVLRYPQPVRSVGPRVRIGDGVDISLLTDGGVWSWGAGGAARMAHLRVEEARDAAFLSGDAIGGRVCYAVGPSVDRHVDCADPSGVQTVATVGAAETALIADGALAWRTDAGCLVRLVEGEPAGPFPCGAAKLPAWPSGDAVIVWDADQGVHRVSRRGGWSLGRSSAVAVAETGVVGMLDRGALTLVRSDGRRRRGAAIEGEPLLFAAAHGVLAVDAGRRRMLWLGIAGGGLAFDLTDADLQVAEAATEVRTDRASLLLAGARGVLHVDLAAGTTRRVDHTGGDWVGFARLGGGLPDVGLVRVDDGYFAVDLWTGRRDPIGAGQRGGFVDRRAWLADDARIYVVDDPGAMPVRR